MDVSPNLRNLRAMLEIPWVVECIVADVFCCSTAKERVLNSRVVCGVKFDELSVDTLLL